MPDFDVVVVGAGPSGLAAAQRLAAAGPSVVLVDEQPICVSGVDFRGGHLVWGVDDDGHTLLASDPDGGAVRLRGRYIVVATGAYGRVLPFPGWQLPGVVTADRAAVGSRVLVAGSGPSLLPVACALVDLGVHVVGVAEAGVPYRLSSALAAWRHPRQVAEFARYRARLARARVPLWQGVLITCAEGTERVATVTLSTGRTVAVDAVCIGYGFRPQADLARLLECTVDADPVIGDAVPVTDEVGRTSRPDVYVVGDAAGIAGAATARARGLAAAADILHREGLGKKPRPVTRSSKVDGLFPSPAALLDRAFPEDTVICRCEGVTAGEVSAAAEHAAGDLNAAKGWSRAGMGLCQGRECGPVLAALVGGGVLPARMPLRPVPIAGLVEGAPW